MVPEDIPPPPDSDLPPPPDFPEPDALSTPPSKASAPPSQLPTNEHVPPPEKPRDPVSSAAPANPLPFIILLSTAILGAGSWFAYQKWVLEPGLDGPSLKPFKGEIAEDGSQFIGIWKGHDSDEDNPTNWEILRQKDYTFKAVYKKYYEDGKFSEIIFKGTWKTSGAKLAYKSIDKEIKGEDIEWPESWTEVVGDLQKNRLLVQSRQTSSRRSPYTENRVAALGYPSLRKIDLPPYVKPTELAPTEEPAGKAPIDLLVHYDFNGSAENKADRKYEALFNNARFTDKNLPEGFEKAIFFEIKDSFIQIKESETWNLCEEDFSISLWLRIKGSRAEGYGILDSISSTASNSLTGIALHTLGQGSSGALEFLFYHRDAKYRFKGRKKVNDGIWHQVAVTKSGNLVQIYVDGQPDSTTASVSRRSGFGFTPLVLGQFLDTGFPSGAMDNFRLYKRTLSPSEVFAVFESEKPPPAIR